MSATLNLTPELEAGLAARANASGMELERHLLSLVEAAALCHAGPLSGPKDPIETRQQARSAAIRRMMEFGEKYHLSLGEPITRALARGHSLTAYDAAYLDLALRTDFPLASTDGPLKKAALRGGSGARLSVSIRWSLRPSTDTGYLTRHSLDQRC